MKSKKYSNHAEAIQDLEKSGELKYFGREGTMADGYVYQFISKGKVCSIVVYKDGKLVVVHERLDIERNR